MNVVQKTRLVWFLVPLFFLDACGDIYVNKGYPPGYGYGGGVVAMTPVQIAPGGFSGPYLHYQSAYGRFVGLRRTYERFVNTVGQLCEVETVHMSYTNGQSTWENATKKFPECSWGAANPPPPPP